MGQWENEMRNALDQYSGNISNNYSGLSNRALGALANAAWARQAEIDAERKRQLEVQKQKDADAALERKLKLQEMQFKMDALNEAREQAKNSQTLLTTFAPYQPSSGFDSKTGENITRANIPLDPILQATSIAGGLNMIGPDYDESKTSNIEPTNIMKKVFEDSIKAISAESQDPEKYKTMSDQERQKAIDNILAPYEITYETRQMTPDIYKANKIYDRNIYNTDAKLVMNQNTNETKENVAGINANAKVNAASISANGGIQKEKIKGENNLKAKDKEIAAKMEINMRKLYISLRNQISSEMPAGSSPEEIDKKTRDLLELKLSKDLSKNDFKKTMNILDKIVTEPRNKAMSKEQMLDKEISYANK